MTRFPDCPWPARWLALLGLAAGLAPPPAPADAPAPAFATANLSPLAGVYGLPRITWAPEPELRLTLDWANHYTGERDGYRVVLLDGETRRLDLLATGALPLDGARWRLDLPYLAHGGGRMDGLIEDWHRTFGLPGGGREDIPPDRLLFGVLDKDGDLALRLDRSRSGPGDVAAAVSAPLPPWGDSGGETLAGLRVEAPTGKAESLLGSGGWDIAGWLATGGARPLIGGPLRWHVAGGALYMSGSEVLPEIHRRWAGFGRVAGTWTPLPRLSLRAQLDAHTGFYDSPLAPLGGTAMELRFGGAVRLGEGYRLDLGVSEDVAVETAPDITFHVGIAGRG